MTQRLRFQASTRILTQKRIETFSFLSTLGPGFRKVCFRQKKSRILVDGRPKRTRLFHEKIVSVWTGPQIQNRHICRSLCVYVYRYGYRSMTDMSVAICLCVKIQIQICDRHVSSCLCLCVELQIQIHNRHVCSCLCLCLEIQIQIHNRHVCSCLRFPGDRPGEGFYVLGVRGDVVFCTASCLEEPPCFKDDLWKRFVVYIKYITCTCF